MKRTRTRSCVKSPAKKTAACRVDDTTEQLNSEVGSCSSSAEEKPTVDHQEDNPETPKIDNNPSDTPEALTCAVCMGII